MGDLIERQAAIDDMKNMYQAAEKWGREATDDVIKARAESCMATLFEMKLRIEKLPSAQPEERTEERTETNACDLINRQAAIDAIVAWTVEDRPDVEMPTDLIDRIKALPSAQPEITMEGVEEYCRKRCLIVITNELFHQMRAKWSQPEIIRCKDCKWFGDIGCAISIVDDSDKPTENDFCSFAERRTDGDSV